jgi:Histidine kinase-, DNA gyrase B-, and HSP90-like ATPase
MHIGGGPENFCVFGLDPSAAGHWGDDIRLILFQVREQCIYKANNGTESRAHFKHSLGGHRLADNQPSPQKSAIVPKVVKRAGSGRGKLRIGDDWNAIRIIALSQSNPLKAIAEFVENSIDAKATVITITRGREHNEHYLSIKDDGNGVPQDADGLPDFKYVATHICDSIKRRLKADGGGAGLQGEYGIGLLSFWTVGDHLTMTSTGADQRAYQMTMSNGDSSYQVAPRRSLFAERGTELKISPLLEGIRTLSGEKIQWYLASELRDRIRDAKVRVTVIDKLARKQYEVEPRQFEGRLLHQLPAIRTSFGDAYAELYLAEPAEMARVALTRTGTRVIEDLATLSGLERSPWNSRYLQGLIDVPFLSLTPGTRNGIIQDDRYAALVAALEPLERRLQELIDEQKRAEEEQASQQSLKAIQKAFHEAMLALPREEYDWFDVQGRARQEGNTNKPNGATVADAPGAGADGLLIPGLIEAASTDSPQRQFFDYAGPLYSVVISPASSTVPFGEIRKFRAMPRDRSRRRVTEDLHFAWQIADDEGEGFRVSGGINSGVSSGVSDDDGANESNPRDRAVLNGISDQELVFQASNKPGLLRLRVTVTQREVTCSADALVTITDSFEAAISPSAGNARGLPGYAFERAAGELWRCRFDAARNIIVVNSGHRDFVFATRNRALQLRYLVRLYVKELILKNFAGLPSDQLLERMVELSLYAEEKLKSG